MGNNEELIGLLDKLGAASLEAKGLLSEIRGAIKDLRQAEREAVDHVHKLMNESVHAKLEAEVHEQITKLGDITQRSMKDTEAKVVFEFNRLTEPMYAILSDMFPLMGKFRKEAQEKMAEYKAEHPEP